MEKKIGEKWRLRSNEQRTPDRTNGAETERQRDKEQRRQESRDRMDLFRFSEANNAAGREPSRAFHAEDQRTDHTDLCQKQ